MHPVSHARTLIRTAALTAALLLTGCADAPTAPDAAAPSAPRASVSAAAAPTVNFRVLIDSVTRGIIANSTNAYVVPTATNRAHFQMAIDSVLAGRISGADALLAQYAYDVYSIREATTLDSLVVFRERLAPGSTKVGRGWGTFAFNPAPQQRADVHVNHPIDDLNTEDIGSELFRDCRCRWFLMAGARRSANFNNDSDVAHQSGSIFHAVHQKVASSDARALSIHGFRESKHPALPDGVDYVLSNGASSNFNFPVYSSAEFDLRDDLRAAGFIAGLYDLDAGYDELGGKTNVQGRHSNDALGFGHWIHVETEYNVRTSTTLWRQANDIMRQWIAGHPAS